MNTPINSERDSVESTALFGLVADIRAAVGDPTGKLMQDELIERCRALRECAEYIADPKRKAWKSGGRGVAVAIATKAISWPNAQSVEPGGGTKPE